MITSGITGVSRQDKSVRSFSCVQIEVSSGNKWHATDDERVAGRAGCASLQCMESEVKHHSILESTTRQMPRIPYLDENAWPEFILAHTRVIVAG